MALLSLTTGGGALEQFCTSSMSPLGGMMAMYLMMAAFHSAPWLRLIAGNWNARS